MRLRTAVAGLATAALVGTASPLAVAAVAAQEGEPGPSTAAAQEGQADPSPTAPQPDLSLTGPESPPPPANEGLPDANIVTEKSECGVGVFKVKVVQEPPKEFTFTVDGNERAIRAHPVKVGPGEHTAKVTYVDDERGKIVMDKETMTIEECDSSADTEPSPDDDMDTAEPADPVTKQPSFTG